MEAAALVGLGDGVAGADDLLEELALGAVPAGDALAHVPVEGAEVGLDLAEVGEELGGHGGELLVAVALGGGVEDGDAALADLGDLGVDLGAAGLELGEPDSRVGLGAAGELAQELEDGVEAGLGADEGPPGERGDPPDSLLDRGCRVVVRLVRAGPVVLAQPAGVAVRPRIEVGLRVARVGRGVGIGIEDVELVVQERDELGLPDGAHVLLDEDAPEERQHEGRVVGAEEPPGGAVAAQGLDVVVVHRSLPSVPHRPVPVATSGYALRVREP